MAKSRSESVVANAEDLIAEIQRGRAGVSPWRLDDYRSRVVELMSSQDGDVSKLLDDLIRDGDGPVLETRLDLDSTTPMDRDASYEAWREEAVRRLPELWSWMKTLHATNTWRTWWHTNDTTRLSLMRQEEPNAQLESVGKIIETWAERAGIATTPTPTPTPIAEQSWRWLALGRWLDVRVPDFAALLAGLVRTYRERGFLDAAHRVRVVKKPNQPPSVVPCRVPGESLLLLPAAASPLTIEYLQHELAHVAEHALRASTAPLARRWQFDPVLSEGWALLMETPLKDPRVLEQHCGLSPNDAAEVARFFHDLEIVNRALTSATVALDDRLANMHTRTLTLVDAIRAAEDVLAELGLHSSSPAIFLFRIPQIRMWRAYEAARCWRDDALDILEARFGQGWMDAADAWSALRRMLAAMCPAADALELLAR